MRNDNGQVLIVSLWILALLTVLAVSLGHRAATGLKLAQYEVDKLKAHALARAGLNVVVAETTIEDLSSGSRSGAGASGRDDFKEIRVPGSQDGFATVSYRFQDDGADRTVYGVFDEEKKININKAPRELLVELLRTVGVPENGVAGNICAWRGDSGISIPDYSEAGYVNKGASFSSPEELALVKGVDRQAYDRLKEHITVWGDDIVNVNTASKVVLDSLVAYGRNRITSGENDTGDLAEQIMAVRPVDSLGDLTDKLQGQYELSAAELNVLNELADMVDVYSAYMHIFSTGRVVSSQVSSTIECVMNRGKGRVVYWHEN